MKKVATRLNNEDYNFFIPNEEANTILTKKTGKHLVSEIRLLD
jgi:hypothetical protein